MVMASEFKQRAVGDERPTPNLPGGQLFAVNQILDGADANAQGARGFSLAK
jgi:hypothetical protein